MNAVASSPLDALLEHLTTLLQQADYPTAEREGLLALQQHPDAVELLRLHAITLRQLERLEEARQLLQRAETLAPANVEVQCNFASLELASGQAEPAIERLRAILRLNPGHPVILLTLGHALMAEARYGQARNSFAMATHGAPAHPGLRLQLAEVELALDHPELAAGHAREALQIMPQLAAAHALLGQALRRLGQPTEAVRAFEEAERLEAGQAEHAYQAGRVLQDMGLLKDAQQAYERALAINPHHGAALGQYVFVLRQRADWAVLPAASRQLREAVAQQRPGIAPFGFLAEDADAASQLRCAQTFAQAVQQQLEPLRRQLAFKHVAAGADTPIRVGMVSAEFGEQATGQLLVALIEALRDSDLQLHLYATAPSDGGPTRQRLEAAAAVHAVETLGAAALAGRIQQDGIELLIDLAGPAEPDPTRLFALRPAPLQVSWLGYPGSRGAPWIDYLLTDAQLLPGSQRPWITEKPVWLPRCALPSGLTRPVAAAPSREACGLPASGTVFACFNALYKITPAVFERFARVLTQTEGSVLWLHAEGADVQERLRHAAHAAGLDPRRLVFLPTLPLAERLARYQHVDLALDTMPCNGRSAAIEVLSAGCPMLTLSGPTMAGRIGTSLLLQAGLPELVVEDDEAFVAMAVSLGRHPQALTLLRQHLIQQRDNGSLFDMAAYAADFRRAIQAMVARWRIGRPAAEIDLSTL